MEASSRTLPRSADSQTRALSAVGATLVSAMLTSCTLSPFMRSSTAAAAVLLRMKGDTVQDVSIALTNVAPTALKAKLSESALRGKALGDATMKDAANLAMGICDPVGDQRGDAEYKTAMAGEMVQKALRTAYARAAR